MGVEWILIVSYRISDWVDLLCLCGYRCTVFVEGCAVSFVGWAVVLSCSYTLSLSLPFKYPCYFHVSEIWRDMDCYFCWSLLYNGDHREGYILESDSWLLDWVECNLLSASGNAIVFWTGKQFLGNLSCWVYLMGIAAIIIFPSVCGWYAFCTWMFPWNIMLMMSHGRFGEEHCSNLTRRCHWKIVLYVFLR